MAANRRRAARLPLLRGEVLRPPPRQARSRENRRRIKAAAQASFRELGYEATTIGAIARRARVPIGGVYLHFASKRQLLLVLMDDLLESLSEIDFTPGARTPRQAVRDLLHRGFNRDLAFLGAYRAWQEAVLADRQLARRDIALHRWTERRVARAFAALRRLPGARPDTDLKALASAMDRFYWSLMAEALRPNARGLARRIDVAVDVTYHALFLDAADRATRLA